MSGLTGESSICKESFEIVSDGAGTPKIKLWLLIDTPTSFQLQSPTSVDWAERDRVDKSSCDEDTSTSLCGDKEGVRGEGETEELKG